MFQLLIRHGTICFQAWSEEQTRALDPSMRDAAWTVPASIVEHLPSRVRSLLGCTMSPLVVLRTLDMVDLCAGVGRLARAAEMGGLLPCALDRAYADWLDFTTDEGLAVAAAAVLRVVPGGLCFAAPQCSSWVWVGRKTTGRSAASPLGNVDNPRVREGNVLNQHMALLCALASLAGITWVVEQPSSSLFFKTPAWVGLIQTTGARRLGFSMKDFGHPNNKATTLYGNASWLEGFGRTGPSRKYRAEKGRKALSRPFVTKTKATGGKSVTGLKAMLKDSQVYPVPFVLAVVSSHWPERFAVQESGRQ